MKKSVIPTVWDRDRTGHNTMSKRGYLAAISFWTLYGLLLTSYVAYRSLAWDPGLLMFLFIGLVIPIIGIIIALNSDEWLISLFGYTLVVVCMGAVMGPAVVRYEVPAILNALAATTGVTVVMSVIGITYPKSLESWSGYLLGGLGALIFVRFAQIFLAAQGIDPRQGLEFIDYLAAILFSLYIIYDWNRALRIDWTFDNSIDVALSLFLDIINLFLSLLNAQGSSSSD